MIRREFRLVEGDPFNTTRMQRSKERIQNLGFFKKVEVTNAPGSAPDRTVIVVDVEEQSTGELSLGRRLFHAPTARSPMFTSASEISSAAARICGSVPCSRSVRSRSISASPNRIFSTRISRPASICSQSRPARPAISSSGGTPAYQQTSYGGALRAGYQITEDLRQTWKYTARSDNITDVASNASLFIQLQAGRRSTSEIGQVLLYDRRDNRIDPTDGYFASLGNDFAGVGFGVQYLRNKVNVGYYYSVAPQWVLSVTGEAGYIFGWGGDPVFLQDRFFVGGDNLRGFAAAGIGPRDIVSGDALGGNKVLSRHGLARRSARPAEGARS